MHKIEVFTVLLKIHDYRGSHWQCCSFSEKNINVEWEMLSMSMFEEAFQILTNLALKSNSNFFEKCLVSLTGRHCFSYLILTRL